MRKMVGKDLKVSQTTSCLNFNKLIKNQNQLATAEMLYGSSGKLVGIGSSLPCANALARTYIWLDVAPAASTAFVTRSQLRASVDI